MYRTAFLVVVLTVAPACQQPAASLTPVPDSAFAHAEWSVRQTREAMAAGRLSSEALTGAYLNRISRLNPRLNAMIAVNPAALAEARARDRERKAGRVRGPLHGIPVALKDNVAMQGLPTTAGSLALAGIPTVADAPLVQRLRAAGAVILGKTNLSEWANFRGLRSSSGFSAAGGQTRNPYVLDRSPCGSSSGSAVAVSANLTLLAIGTETDGSIVCPSSATGIVGLKPGAGKLPSEGIVPVSTTQDTPGPMARTVRDVAELYGALRNEERAITPWPLDGVRVGVVQELPRFTAETQRLYRRATRALVDAGAVPVRLERLPDYDRAFELELFQRELGPGLAAYLARYTSGQAPKSLEAIIAFNESHHDDELRWYGQEHLLAARDAGAVDDPEFRRRLQRYRRGARAALDALLMDDELVAILVPSGTPAWPIDLINGDHFIAGSSGLAAAAGYPILSLPMGDVEGLPVGMSLIGTEDSEWALLELGVSLEALWDARRVPALKPTLEPPGPVSAP